MIPYLRAYALIIVCLYACSEPVPKLAWSEEKAVEVLTDLRIMDAQVKKHLASERDSVMAYFRDILLQTHNISNEELTENILIIQSDPKLSSDLEKKVNELLNNRIDEIKGNSK